MTIGQTTAALILALIPMMLLTSPALGYTRMPSSDFLDFDIPPFVRVILVIAGIVILCIGYYIYEFLIALPGFFLGAALGVALAHNESGVVIFLAAVVLGFIGAGIALLIYKIAIFLIGALVGGALLAVISMAITRDEPNVAVAIIGGIIGGILALAIHKFMIIVISSVIGALAITNGLKSESVGLFVVLIAIGIAIQSGMSRVLKRPDEEGTDTSKMPLRFPSLRGTADIGSVLLKKKKYAEAIEYYNKILGNSPDNFDAWYNIASAYLGTQAYGDAMECINKAIDLRPNDKDTLKLRDIIDHYL